MRMAMLRWLSRRTQSLPEHHNREMWPIRILFEMSQTEFTKWMRGLLREQDTGPLVGEIGQQFPESFVKSLSDRETLRACGVGSSVADEFVERIIPQALAELLKKWGPGEGLDYLEKLVSLAGYFSVIQATGWLYEQFCNPDIIELTRAKPTLRVDMLAALLELADTSGEAAMKARLIKACKETYSPQPLFTAVCFHALCQDSEGKEDVNLIPILIEASLKEPAVKVFRVLERHYEAYPERLRDEEVLAATLEGVVARASRGSISASRPGEMLGRFLDEYFMFGAWFVPCYRPYFEVLVPDEQVGFHVYWLEPEQAPAGLCVVNAEAIPTTWELIDSPLVRTIVTELPGYETSPALTVSASTTRRGRNAQ